MPTGYTAKVQDGATFEEFVWGCARAFGALIEMRDDAMDTPIPEQFEPSSYNTKRLAETKAELTRVLAMSDTDCATEAKAEYDKARQYKIEADAKDTQTAERYNAMIARVDDWEPPTPEHVELKRFMLQQLNESVRFDCGYERKEPKPFTAQEWRTQKLEQLRRDVVYHQKEHEAELERTASRNKWIADLRESVKMPLPQRSSSPE